MAVPAKFLVPGTGYEIAFRTPESKPVSRPPSDALLKALAVWLANNFDLPRNASSPAIELVSPVKIATFRYMGFLSDKPQDTASIPPGQRQVVAAYDADTGTVYLSEGWTGNTPAEISVLVHEMVHHLQYVAGTRFECPQAREELAYAAQQKWLSLFGRNLTTDFDIDGFTLLVSTRCAY
jgi:hypothetical protein